VVVREIPNGSVGFAFSIFSENKFLTVTLMYLRVYWWR
jgi:hypothetical protein